MKARSQTCYLNVFCISFFFIIFILIYFLMIHIPVGIYFYYRHKHALVVDHIYFVIFRSRRDFWLSQIFLSYLLLYFSVQKGLDWVKILSADKEKTKHSWRSHGFVIYSSWCHGPSELLSSCCICTSWAFHILILKKINGSIPFKIYI